MKINRNAQCPCASGKKYKKCCGVDVGLNTASFPSTSPASNPVARHQFPSLVEGLEIARASIREFASKPEQSSDPNADWIFHLDKDYQNTRYYAAILSEMLENKVTVPTLFVWLPTIRADLHDYTGNIATLIPELLQKAEESAKDFGIIQVNMRQFDNGLLWGALTDNRLSFDIKESATEIPIISKFMGQSQQVYCPQYVADQSVFSVHLNDTARVPLIVYSNPDRDQFFSSYSFTHELIHVLHRVFRKERIPAYSYTDMISHRTKYRNHEQLIACGIDDELEVQAILSRAYAGGSPFNLNATLFHIRSMRKDWTDAGYDETDLRSTVEMPAGIQCPDDAGACDSKYCAIQGSLMNPQRPCV